MHLPSVPFPTRHWLFAALALLIAGCDQGAERIRVLEEENARLRVALEAARGATAKEAGASTAPELNVTLTELWTERFGPNQLRFKKRLDAKQVRVTGEVESVRPRSVTLFAVGTRMGSVTLSAQLEDAYARSVGEAFTSLLPGTTVTLQGKFAAQRTGLDDAAFVDRTTGRRLTAEDFKKLDAREAETVAPKTSAPGRIQLR